jgi:hypothetical protein
MSSAERRGNKPVGRSASVGRRRAVDERYELAPLHLITSSARMEVEVEAMYYGGRGQCDFTIARSARRRALTGAVVSPRHHR